MEVSEVKRYFLFVALITALSACSKEPVTPTGPAANVSSQSGSGATAPAQTAAASGAPSMQTLPDFAAVVDANKGAVVNITATKNAPAQAAAGEDDDDNPLNEFLRRFQGPMPRMPMQGMGSGFIVHADGVVLTNAHVVEGADEVRVRLTDRREFKGKVLGADKPSDIAVVKIEAKGLPVVKLGDPARVRVGEWVLAIGSPFGFDSTATVGIVSA